ncbi:TPA: hypothetical protein HA344_10635 [Candidatus Bathyarchaeota archaeon]|nr:hypothetical protein [Candidatus Bathyarchaeota archaeon]
MNTPFTADERRAFLDKYFSDLAREEELDNSLLNEAGPSKEMEELDSLHTSLSEAREQYRLSVPVVPLSRCPYTMEVVYHSLDNYGLDGLWWDNEVPIRPVDVLPSTFFTLNGALKFGGPIEDTPFPVRPGPEVPYVVPEVLSAPGVKAVISSTVVGAHTAYPVFYFIDDWGSAMEPMNLWGANYWQYLDREGALKHNEYGGVPIEDDSYYEYTEDDAADDSDEPEYTQDFELKKWVEQGKLLWIAPGDGSFTLKTGVADCPYLNLEGSRAFSVIRNGEKYDDVLGVE